MGLSTLVFGLIVFFVPHVFVTRRDARARLIARIGEGPYKIAFSILSAIGIILIAYGFARYRANEWVNLWYPPVWARHLALQLNWLAIVCIVAAYIPGNIKRVLKHPMLVGVKIWALAHLIANGDLGSVILFGSILAWAVFDRISLKRRSDQGTPDTRNGGWPADVVALVVGTVIYAAIVLLVHPLIIGVPVLQG
ncbi:NnrU family protein [Pseudorhodoplanes sp.]|uniref:NnrU family protein n=1 Tax=Pseudorhodoplanes sp. TaxID=1934341 RepID=UPI002CC72839|nr:NnrU family protein [Pseudorhodoplanes sp.]HWV55037.1 NnrU family protein [Pseudorhodoplanes sp.]